MTNKYRNEVTIKLDGEEYLLRGTFGCLVAIESAADKTVSQILDKASDNALYISHVFDILCCGIRAVDPDVDMDKLELNFANTSIAETSILAIQFLIQAIEIPTALKKK